MASIADYDVIEACCGIRVLRFPGFCCLLKGCARRSSRQSVKRLDVRILHDGLEADNR